MTRQTDELSRTLLSLHNLAAHTHGSNEVLTTDLLAMQVPMSASPELRTDVDAWAEGQADLGARVAKGREAQRRMHAMSGEDQHTRIMRHENNETTHRRLQQEAVEAARRMTTLDPTTKRRTWAALTKTWSDKHRSAIALAEKLSESEADMRQAKAELAEMEQDNSALHEIVERGEAADLELSRRIRDYVAAVDNAYQFWPKWLVRVLGIGSPPDDWRPWLRTAADVIHYRIVYRVKDQAEALGEKPTSKEQRKEYDKLTQACESHRL